MLFRTFLAAALAASALAAQAQVNVGEPWVRATVAGQMATGAFMTLTAARPARLLGASSPVAGVVEVHEMRIEDKVMRMRAIESLDLPAGKPLELKPGGYHVMLMDLKRTLKEGETVSAAAIAGKADIREVVTAVANAQMTLDTVVTVRDKVINAYNEIMRMPI